MRSSGRASGFPSYGMMFYIVGVLTALLTAFYMTRLMMKTFFTDQRFNEADLGKHGHGGHGSDTGHDHLDQGEDAIADDHSHADAHAHGICKPPPSMWIPLAILAVLSAVAGFIGMPWNNQFEKFLEPAVAHFEAHEAIPTAVGMAIGALAGLLGLIGGRSTTSSARPGS